MVGHHPTSFEGANSYKQRHTIHHFFVVAPGVLAVAYCYNRAKDNRSYAHSGRSHCTANPIYVFPEMKLGGLVPNSYIHVSVSDLYIPRIGLSIWLQHLDGSGTEAHTAANTRSQSYSAAATSPPQQRLRIENSPPSRGCVLKTALPAEAAY
jgi:hypothetical protein